MRVERDVAGAAPFLLTGALLLAAFVAVERRTRAPLVRLAILRERPLTGANLAEIANAGGFTGMTFMATLYMQPVLGYGALEAGLRFIPLALTAGVGGVVAPRIIARVGARRTAVVSLAATAAAFLFLARLPAEDGYVPVLLPAFLVAGFGFAMAFVPLTSQGVAGVREGEKGLAAGVLLLGAICAVRILPAGGSRVIPSG